MVVKREGEGRVKWRIAERKREGRVESKEKRDGKHVSFCVW